MRLICISDTHGLHDDIVIPEGDVLIHAGDFCNWGRIGDVLKFNIWLGKLPHTHKLICAGNHDIYMQKQPVLARSLITNGIYLENEGVSINGINFYASPWTNIFMDWAFMKSEEELNKVFSKIPLKTDIIITHGPAYGHLDKVDKKYANEDSDFHVGSKSLLKHIKRVKPKYIFCGHIHCGYGESKIGDTLIYNVSTCNEDYKPVNKPIIIDI